MSRSLGARPRQGSNSKSGPTTHEIIPNRLYYVALTRKPQDTSQALYFTTDNTLVYWNFFLDFGPLNLGQTYRFCELLNRLLAAPEHKNKVIYYYSSTHSHRRTNSVTLMTAWSLIYLGRTPEEAFAPFEDAYPAFPPFHDASPCVCSYKLTVRKFGAVLVCCVCVAREHIPVFLFVFFSFSFFPSLALLISGCRLFFLLDTSTHSPTHSLFLLCFLVFSTSLCFYHHHFS